METKKLKVIAEGMGYTNVFIREESGLLFAAAPNEGQTFGVYHPDENNDQMVEIVNKFQFDINWFELSCVIFLNGDMIGEGNTINEAVCNAAYEYFKEGDV